MKLKLGEHVIAYEMQQMVYILMLLWQHTQFQIANFPKDPNWETFELNGCRNAAEDSKRRWNEIQTDGNYKSLLTAFSWKRNQKRPWRKEDGCRRASPRKRPPPSARFSLKKSKRRVEESFREESFTVSCDITSKVDDTVSLETAEIVNTELKDSCESLQFQCYKLLQAQEATVRLDEEVSILK